MSQKQELRQQMIREKIMSEQSVYVDQLSELFHVSANTIRRDLVHLEQSVPSIIRFHGGAIYNHYGNHPFHYDQRDALYLEEKRNISAYALSLIQDRHSVVLDSGTTTSILADLILQQKNSRENIILTPSSVIFDKLKDELKIPPALSGGFWDKHTQGFYGLPAENFFLNTHASLLFLGVMGVSSKGLFINSFQEIPLKQSMLKTSNKKIVLADSSKIGVSLVGHIAPLNSVDLVITGKQSLDNPAIEEIAGIVKVHYV